MSSTLLVRLERQTCSINVEFAKKAMLIRSFDNSGERARCHYRREGRLVWPADEEKRRIIRVVHQNSGANIEPPPGGGEGAGDIYTINSSKLQ